MTVLPKPNSNLKSKLKPQPKTKPMAMPKYKPTPTSSHVKSQPPKRKPSSSSTHPPTSAHPRKPTPFQRLIYAHLLSIPRGRITTYKHLSLALSTSPRAVGGALRANPFAPEVPCHRVIAADGYIGGFKGEWMDAPSGVNQQMKRGLLEGEGVVFDAEGMLIDKERKGSKEVWFHGPWDTSVTVKEVERLVREMDDTTKNV